MLLLCCWCPACALCLEQWSKQRSLYFPAVFFSKVHLGVRFNFIFVFDFLGHVVSFFFFFFFFYPQAMHISSCSAGPSAPALDHVWNEEM